jgi:formate hydrogenlyase subunit 6/NADH:ubiquinone oxidoreductase subunit I
MLKEAVSQFYTKPTTQQYPFVKPQLPESFRGQPLFDAGLCIGCGLCSRECPSKAIEMVDFEGKKRPQHRLDKCIFCYLCAEICPKKAVMHSTNFELATMDKSTLTIKPSILPK